MLVGNFRFDQFGQEGQGFLPADAGVWYHVMNCGHRGGELFMDDTDRRRFLGALGELPERFGLEVHAFVLMAVPIYAGANPNPGWLETGAIGTGCGGRSRAERLAALKAFTERPIRQGVLSSPWEGLVGGVVLGDREYVQRVGLVGGGAAYGDEV